MRSGSKWQQPSGRLAPIQIENVRENIEMFNKSPLRKGINSTSDIYIDRLRDDATSAETEQAGNQQAKCAYKECRCYQQKEEIGHTV